MEFKFTWTPQLCYILKTGGGTETREAVLTPLDILRPLRDASSRGAVLAPLDVWHPRWIAKSRGHPSSVTVLNLRVGFR